MRAGSECRPRLHSGAAMPISQLFVRQLIGSLATARASSGEGQIGACTASNAWVQVQWGACGSLSPLDVQAINLRSGGRLLG